VPEVTRKLPDTVSVSKPFAMVSPRSVAVIVPCRTLGPTVREKMAPANEPGVLQMLKLRVAPEIDWPESVTVPTKFSLC
jgi:hypothetical protein